MTTDERNAETSRREVAEWLACPPDSYFLYVNEKKRQVTTWTGDTLGGYSLNGPSWRDNFGSERVPIYVYGTNGVRYHGTYYRSAGDYARITAYKHQPEPKVTP